MQAIAEGQGDDSTYNDKRYRGEVDIEIEEGVPDKGCDEIDGITDLTHLGKDFVGKAFEAEGGLIESKTNEDGCGCEDHPGDACGDIGRCGVEEKERQAYDQAQGADHRCY